ncbi:hypothetical protein DMH04_41700 [Kibdelosporangium aridum]|uniref:Methyltransferase domain-containing protein n=2 Tax=Kibdelosporangium aridum TaxID=2030 RepID=A0A428YTV8_KIBAR|nr:hypothetical protein DMH04_41700 [Kibdelosporangium aridum]
MAGAHVYFGMTTVQDLQSRIQANDQVIWSAAALVLALRTNTPPDLRDASLTLLHSLGIDVDLSAENDPVTVRQGLAAQAASAILQSGALLRGDRPWADQSEETMQAQGRLSARGARLFKDVTLPLLPGLDALLARPGARMLDVGTGVGALAIAYAELFPALTVVGLDIMPSALKLAAQNVAESTVPHRVELRNQDVGDLTEVDTYSLAWIPAPFVSGPALREGLKRIREALIPGGWVIMGHAKIRANEGSAALSRLQTAVYGGTLLDDMRARDFLIEAGFAQTLSLPTPPGAPAITAGHR